MKVGDSHGPVGAVMVRSRGPAAVGRPGRLRALAGAAATASAFWLLLGGQLGVVAGLATGALAYRRLRRVEPTLERHARRRAAADLPFAADLLAAALRAGAPTEHAVRVVGDAIGGPLGGQLRRVSDALTLGLEPADAWACLRVPADAVRIATTVIRSADSGAAIARALHRLADDLRASRTADVDAAAQRVGVLIVLPLGLCFLPAFVFAGIAPVIVAVLGGVLR